MIEPPLPDDEASRLAALEACNILDTPPEESFDDLARVAAQICGAPVALVSLVDADRQWFKARVNFDGVQTSRRVSFCAHAVATNRELVVPDTLADERFADNPLVVSRPRFRFYAGVPLHADGGSPVGTLCVLDVVPRDISAAQLNGLRALGRQISKELVLRRELARRRALDGHVVVGDTICGWRVVREIGEGAVGTVYEVVSEDRRGAMKVLRPEWASQSSVIERFVREARILMKLRDPNVARLLDVGNLDATRGELPYLVLEYLEGTDLDRIIAHRGFLAADEALRWCAEACSGLAAAHDLGVIHRDLKPSNIFLVRRPDGTESVKLIDFGIATNIDRGDAKLTHPDAPIGTILYMAPEQLLCAPELDQRADLWSMGVVLYEMLTGRMPFPGKTEIEISAAVLTRPPLPMRIAVPDAIEQSIRRCLAKDPADRYPDARSLRAALLR